MSTLQPLPTFSDDLYSCYSDSSTDSLETCPDMPFKSFVHDMIEQKEVNKDLKLRCKWERYHPGMIAGDIFTVGYTAFAGVQYLSPALKACSAVGWVTSLCGEIGGAINIWVACQEFKEAYQAYKNGDNLTCWKNAFDATFLICIGVLMILISVSLKVACMASISAFFVAHPWILPLLFFVITLPLLTEIAYRVKIICTHENLASKLNLDAIKQTLGKTASIDWSVQLKGSAFESLYALYQQNPSDEQLSTKFRDTIEKLQADMGVEAALEASKLFESILDDKNNQAILDQLETTQKEITKWYSAQYTRLFQQILYIIAFAISMGAFAPGANAAVMNAASSWLMALANLVALGMDVLWPFKRNIAMIVPQLEDEACKHCWDRAFPAAQALVA